MGSPALAQNVQKQGPFSDHSFVFRGRRGDLIKLIWFADQNTCQFSKRWRMGDLSGRMQPAASSRPHQRREIRNDSPHCRTGALGTM